MYHLLFSFLREYISLRGPDRNTHLSILCHKVVLMPDGFMGPRRRMRMWTIATSNGRHHRHQQQLLQLLLLLRGSDSFCFRRLLLSALPELSLIPLL